MPPATFTLNNGKTIPTVGLGTWKSAPGEVAKAVEAAIRAGYRHIDCAWGYQNEGEVGEGIRNSGIDRSELFITSKLFEIHHNPEHVELAIKDTLKKLGTDYLDLYLMHWNIAFQVKAPEGVTPTWDHVQRNAEGKVKLDVALSENFALTWKSLEALVEKGLTRSIGISNFNINRTRQLLKTAKIKPVINQVELSIQCPQPELVSWLLKHDIRPAAYSPLGGTDGSYLREHPVINEIAAKHNVGGSSILLSWLLQRGIVVLPKSVTPSRIEANAKVVDLSQEEFDTIDKLSQSHPAKRVCDQSDLHDPFYDIYQEKDPKFSDKVQYALED